MFASVDVHGEFDSCINCGALIDGDENRAPLPILRGPNREMSKMRRRLRPRHEMAGHDPDTCETCIETDEAY